MQPPDLTFEAKEKERNLNENVKVNNPQKRLRQAFQLNTVTKLLNDK